MFELSDIKRLRKSLGLTQTELARKAGVSQSLIAKIESQRIEPTYSNVMKIFGVLSSMNEEDELKASDIMVKRILECKKEEQLGEVIARMRKHGISQLPVLEHNAVVGMVSESAILNRVSGNLADISSLRVSDVMEDCPPVVSQNTSAPAVSNLLRHFPMVVVSAKGKLVGIITKSDLLRAAYRQ